MLRPYCKTTKRWWRRSEVSEYFFVHRRCSNVSSNDVINRHFHLVSLFSTAFPLHIASASLFSSSHQRIYAWSMVVCCEFVVVEHEVIACCSVWAELSSEEAIGNRMSWTWWIHISFILYRSRKQYYKIRDINRIAKWMRCAICKQDVNSTLALHYLLMTCKQIYVFHTFIHCLLTTL